MKARKWTFIITIAFLFIAMISLTSALSCPVDYFIPSTTLVNDYKPAFYNASEGTSTLTVFGESNDSGLIGSQRGLIHDGNYFWILNGSNDGNFWRMFQYHSNFTYITFKNLPFSFAFPFQQAQSVTYDEDTEIYWVLYYGFIAPSTTYYQIRTFNYTGLSFVENKYMTFNLTASTPNNDIEITDNWLIISSANTDTLNYYFKNGTANKVVSLGINLDTENSLAWNDSELWVYTSRGEWSYRFFENGTYSDYFGIDSGNLLGGAEIFNNSLYTLGFDFVGGNFTVTVDKHDFGFSTIAQESAFPPQDYIFDTNQSLNFTIASSSSILKSNYHGVGWIYYEVKNSTGDNVLDIQQYFCNYNYTADAQDSNSTHQRYNFTFQFDIPQGDGDYILTSYIIDGFNYTSQYNISFSVSSDAPAVNLESPINEGWETVNNVSFEFTATDSGGVDTCELWTNSSGTWQVDETLTSVSSGVTSTIYLNLSDAKAILWNVECNDTSGKNGTATSNWTFGIDTSSPNITINSISTTEDSQVVTFNATSSDDNEGTSCSYRIYNLAGGIDSSGTYTCNIAKTFAVSSFATYILEATVTDIAGNTNSLNQSFTVSTSSGGGGGGGGGGTTTTEGNWTLETDTGDVKYELIMIKGTSRTKSLVFENLGTSSRTIDIECSSEDSNICDYVFLENKQIILPLSQKVKTSVDFTIMLPNDIELTSYTFNFIAEDEEGNKGVLTTTIDVRRYSIIKFLSSLQIGNFSINYFLLFVLFATGLYFIFNKVIFLKKSGSVGLSFLLGILISFGIVMII